MNYSRALLLLLVFCFSCSNIDIKNDYRGYHFYINQAEKLIADEEFEGALFLYDTTFASYEFVFLRDQKIAAQLAFQLGRKDEGLKLIKQAMSNGWKWEAIKEQTFLQKHLDKADWEELEDAQEQLSNEYETRINSALQEKIRQMFQADQNLAGMAAEIEDEEEQEAFIIRKFPPHSAKQLQKLLTIIREEGYPGEKLIGNDYWVSTIVSHHNSISTEEVKKDTLFPSLRPLLEKALVAGEISPYEWALMEDWRIAVTSDHQEAGFGYLNAPSRASLQSANKRRKELGLRSIELRNRLVDVQNKTGLILYLPDWVDGKIEVKE